MALTDRVVRFTRPAEKAQYLIDGGGLLLKVLPSGTKTWYVRSQAGRERWVKIGRYPGMSLLEARVEASKRIATGLQAARTVTWAYTEYSPHMRRSYASWEEIDRRFQSDVLPQLGARKLDQVTKEHCGDLLNRIVRRGAPVAANRTMADMQHFFNYCVGRGWIDESPMVGITRKVVGGREKSKERALTFDELSRLIPELAADRFHLETRLALGLILLTGQRSSEVLGYHERERHGCWWTIPAERTKPKREQKVYLSPPARHLLKLAVQHLGKKPFTCDHRTLSKAVRRLKWPVRFTPHDLRRTMATRLADLGVLPHVVEKMLNHLMEGPMAVYNRAEYLPERRAAWRLWGRTLSKLRRQHARSHSSGPSRRMYVRSAGAVHGAEREGGVLDEVQRRRPLDAGLLPEGR